MITSDSPEVLNLPWELLYSPSDRQFLAPSLAGMSRSLSDYAVRAQMSNLPQDKLNILLVIARPYGEKDIALKTIARPLLESVSHIRKKVNIKVLRPPSFEQFERELNAQPGFYHIVHFDGHGDFDPNSVGFQHTLGAAGQGVLVFEADDGSPQIITAAQIAQNLADCRVPIFVLNACKSAQEGEEKFSSVATRLVSLGAKGVVAMAYSVYAQAAKHFMGRLYGELAAGATVDTAVAAGRREVLNKRLRPSPKGDKPLQDWLHAFSESLDAKDSLGSKQVYQAVFGENLQNADWLKLLNEAAVAGILEHLGGKYYKIHPALPWYLRQRLSEQYAVEEVSELEKKLVIFYAMLAENCCEVIINDAELAISTLQLEEPNLLQNLRIAEQQNEWAIAQTILQPLGEMYKITGRKIEFNSLRLRVLKQLGVNLISAKLKGKEAFDFWIYLQNQDANETAQSGNFEEAKKIYQENLDELTALNDPSASEKIAVFDNLLGNIAWEQRQFDKAVTYYQQALPIFEAAGDEYNLTDIYLQLGTTAQEQQELDQAIDYYQKAFLGYRKFQDWYKASITLVKWGNVLEAQEKWEEALQIYTEFVIDVEHKRELIDLRIKAWARILQQLGKNQFFALWQEVTGEECFENLRSAIWAARDRLDS